MPPPTDLPDRPVFVDPSGRRRRTVRRLAIAACALLATYAVLLGAALSGAPIPPSALLPLPGAPATAESATTTEQQNRQPAETTFTSSHPKHASAATPSATAPTPTSQPAAGPTVTTTSTTSNRNSHAPTAPPGRTKHTDTTTPTP